MNVICENTNTVAEVFSALFGPKNAETTSYYNCQCPF